MVNLGLEGRHPLFEYWRDRHVRRWRGGVLARVGGRVMVNPLLLSSEDLECSDQERSLYRFAYSLLATRWINGFLQMKLLGCRIDCGLLTLDVMPVVVFIFL